MRISVPPEVEAALDRLWALGCPAYPVGGCVRDSLLGKTPADWDICTAAVPEAVLACFADCRALPTGLRHGTVTVYPGGRAVEVTTFRREGSYSDHRRPDAVAFVRELETDLARRDFTINAMALSREGAVLDPFGGQADLEGKRIRCVGDPAQRFREDSLRILRALRFAARLGFSIETKTAAAMRAAVPLLAALAPERVYGELKGILPAPGAGGALRGFPEIFAALLPECAAWPEAAARVDALPEDFVARAAALFASPAQAGAALTRLKSDKATRTRVAALLAQKSAPPEDRAAALALLAALGRADCARLLRLWPLWSVEAPPALQAVLAEEAPCLSVRDLAIGGAALLARGVPPGPAVGAALEGLLRAVWRGEAPNEEEALLARLQSL